MRSWLVNISDMNVQGTGFAAMDRIRGDEGVTRTSFGGGEPLRLDGDTVIQILRFASPRCSDVNVVFRGPDKSGTGILACQFLQRQLFPDSCGSQSRFC